MVTGRWQGEGHFILTGWRKEARTMDMAVGTAAARGGRGGDGTVSEGLNCCCEVKSKILL